MATIVFVDIESIGVDPSGPIRQLAAVAVDSQLREIESFEAKLDVDWGAVRKWRTKRRRRPPRPRNHSERACARRFYQFLKRHATTEISLDRRAGYFVAQLAAHHASHDGPFLQAFFSRNRCSYPGDFRMLCTVQRAIWLFRENNRLAPPVDYKLKTLCCYFEVPYEDAKAHDALYDVRATVALYRAMLARRRRNSSTSYL